MVPRGSRTSALTKRLSVEIIEILAAASRGPSSIEVELLHAPIEDDLTPLETCICFAMDRWRRQMPQTGPMNFVVQKYKALAGIAGDGPEARRGFSSKFSESLIFHRAETAVVDCLAWIAIVVGATNPLDEPGTDGQDHRAYLRRLVSATETAWDWPRLGTAMTHFFHDEGLFERGRQLWSRLERT